jgi:hypothetical protein
MPYIKLEGFSGIAPRIGPTNLQPNQAQKARNLKLQSGELRPWRKPVLTYQPSGSDTNTIYKLTNPSTSASVWLEWSGDVNAVPGPIADTSEVRLYYTGDGAPKKTNWNLATTSGTGSKPFPNAYLQMGVPAPTVAPTLSATGGTAPTETRAYVYTYVSTFGSVKEESAPSPAATVTCNTSGSTVTVSAFGTAPTTAAGYNITAIRIYRTISSTYTYVGEVTVTPSTGAASGSFSDTTTTAALIGVTLPSLYYTPPPTGLSGLVALPNGVLAGFVGNQVWFSEPYLPHAWPSSYMMTVGAPIVGLGVFGQTLVVCTTNNPYLITGTTPGAMSQEKLPIPEPCVSKKSIASDQYGVLYASPNGVVSIGQGIADVITRPLMTRDEWANYAPTTIIGVIYQNMYIMFYNAGATRESLILTRADTPPLVSLDTAAKAVFFESTTANVYVVDPTDNQIYQLDADTVNNLFYEWTSKKFVLPSPTNFAVMQVHADWSYISSTAGYNAQVQQIIAANQAIWASGAALNSTANAQAVNSYTLNGSILTPIPAVADTRNMQAIVTGDDTQMASSGFTSQDPVRMPASSRAYVYEIKLTGNAPLRGFAMATSIGELRQV